MRVETNCKATLPGPGHFYQKTSEEVEKLLVISEERNVMFQEQVSDLGSIQSPTEGEIKSCHFVLRCSERGELPIRQLLSDS